MREMMAKIADPNLWSQISAAAFLIGFCLLLCWVYWPARKSVYQEASRLPVQED